jgi:hypothetical protein
MPTPTTTTFITTATWLTYINSSAQELFDLLVQKYGNDYFAALDSGKNPYQFTTDGTNARFALPDGSSTYKMPDTTTNAPAFYKLLGVDLQISGANDWLPLKPFPFIERSNGSVQNSQATRGRNSRLRYRPIGNLSASTPTQYLWLDPLPMSGQIVRVWYIPRFTPLSGDSDTLDGVSGWEEYIVIDAARKAAIKEESYELVQGLSADKAAMVERINAAAENRDAGSPMRVGNSRIDSGWDDDDAGEWD